jgi:tRNA 2-thiouridine synthesizing protein A
VTAATPGDRPCCAAPAADAAPTSPRQGEDADVISPPAEPIVIDGGDRACVALLLELRHRIRQLPAGTVIHLIAWDPAASIDLPAWCHLTGHVYLGSIRAAAPTYALRITAAPCATDAASPWKRRP